MGKTVQDDLIEQNEYCNINSWHDKGLKGDGIVVWNAETFKSEHGQMTQVRVKESAPKAEVITVSLEMSYDGTKVNHADVVLSDGTRFTVEDFIRDKKVKIITRSVGYSFATDEVSSKFWNDLKDKYNLIFFNAAGNEGSNTKELTKDIAIRVGACGLGANGKPRRDNYSAVGEIDFIDFRGFYSGTSFSAPYLAGKAALLVQKYGHQITQEEIYEYFKNHAEDIETAGKDNLSGWGLPIMGSPKTIIKMQIGSDKMTVDAKEVLLDAPPIIQNSRTLVPIRAISEAFGADVGWDRQTKTITIER